MSQSNAIFQHITTAVAAANGRDEPQKLPPMEELAERLGVSRGKVREDMVVAQAYGVVEMRPGDGTYTRPFDFYTPARTAILHGVARDRRRFDPLYDLRVQLEIGFWDEAVRRLGPEEHHALRRAVGQADRKLKEAPVEIPHREHRDFHLTIFSKLENEFVRALLAAYWDAYESVGLHRYYDLSYYEDMWCSHRAIAEAIIAGRYDAGKEVLIQHFTLLQDRLPGRGE